MLELSKFFTNDIVSTNQTLKPVILIVEPANNSVLFTLTQDKEEILDRYGNKLDVISSISKVSNVRLSSDYDSKKLKINRLRCTLYNYYDVNTKLSQFINKGITNKNLYLFYKSPTTNVANINNTLNDYDCALIYKGEISRVEFNKDTLNIVAEDLTEKKISDKNVPYMSVSRLPEEIKNNLTSQYKENDDVVVPMTFGMVDKAPTITYYSNEGNNLNVLLDTFPTSGRHRTSKVPSMLHNYLHNKNEYDYWLYAKSDDDYLIIKNNFRTLMFYESFQYNEYSRFVLHSQVTTENTTYLFPDLSEQTTEGPDSHNIGGKVWAKLGYNVRLPIGVTTGDGSILGIDELQGGENSQQGFFYQSALNDNAGKPKVWYREGDSFDPSMNTSMTWKWFTSQNIDNDVSPPGTGRWIIYRMEKGASNNLFSNGGSWGNDDGNSWVLVDYGSFVSSLDNIPETADRIGFYVAPISSELLKNIDMNNDSKSLILNKLLVTNDEEYNQDSPDIVNSDNPFEKAPIYHTKSEGLHKGNAGYFGNDSIAGNSTETTRMNGYKYGEDYWHSHKSEYTADEENLIAVFEYFPENWYSTNDLYYQSQWTFNNFATLHQVVIPDLTTEEIYASISGRKNHTYTENINAAVYGDVTEIIVEDIPFSYFNENAEGSISFSGYDFSEIAAKAWERVMRLDQVSIPSEYWVGGISMMNGISTMTFETRLNDFIENETWEEVVREEFELRFGNVQNAPVWKTYSVFKLVFKMFLIQTKILKQLGATRSDLGYAPSWLNYEINTALQYHHQSDGNYVRCLWGNEQWIRGFFTYAYEYILQVEIADMPDFTHNYEATVIYSSFFDVAHWEGGTSDYIYGMYKNEDRASTTVNITNDIQNNREYNWNSFNIETFGDWLDNFYIFMDDLSQAFSKALLGDYQDAINLNHFIENAEGLNINNDWIPRYEFNMNEWADSNQWVLGLGALDADNSKLNEIKEDLANTVTATFSEELQEWAVESTEQAFVTDGKIQKPSDIVMNILTNELGYGKYFDDELGNVQYPNYDEYDMDSIAISRAIHANWKMGFSLNEKIDGKKLIEEILNESMSYPRFNSEGKFSLINLKPYYNLNEIDRYIEEKDIIKYKFSETKREDIITSCTMFYRYDNGQEKYNMSMTKDITDLRPSYYLTGANGFYNYNLKDTDGHKDIYLKYHTDTSTVEKFLNYTLLNRCNTHLLVDMTLPLSYMNLTVGDVIRIPLINNEKVFNIDYNAEPYSYKNSQPIYPMWIIMETNIGINSMTLKAYQLHYNNYS